MSEESRVPFETQPASLETAPAPLEGRPPREFSLFWRTFILLAVLLLGCIIAWLQTFRALEFEPRALQSAQQLASLVNLTRAALVQGTVRFVKVFVYLTDVTHGDGHHEVGEVVPPGQLEDVEADVAAERGLTVRWISTVTRSPGGVTVEMPMTITGVNLIDNDTGGNTPATPCQNRNRAVKPGKMHAQPHHSSAVRIHERPRRNQRRRRQEQPCRKSHADDAAIPAHQG